MSAHPDTRAKHVAIARAIEAAELRDTEIAAEHGVSPRTVARIRARWMRQDQKQHSGEAIEVAIAPFNGNGQGVAS